MVTREKSVIRQAKVCGFAASDEKCIMLVKRENASNMRTRNNA
jgi:hypothetical protein